MENCAFKIFFFSGDFLFLFCTNFSPQQFFSYACVYHVYIGSYAPACTPHTAVLYERYLAPFNLNFSYCCL